LMKKVLPLFVLCFLVVSELQAQVTRYLVKLKNKGATTHTIANPSAYLSQRAIDRRTRYGIAIDSTDLPVPSSYITQIRNIPNVTLLNVSKWLNAVTIQTSDAGAIAAINALPFVQSTSGIALRIGNTVSDKFREEYQIMPLEPSGSRTAGTEGDFFDYGTTSFNEIHLHKGEFLHNIGLRGQGIQIAIMDNGFSNYSSPALHAFDSVNANGQVLGTWDFVAREQNVTNDGNHGMQCFSTIAANIPGQFVGKAPKASFWLYQTEDNAGEYPIEEHNWACGAERADSSGADVISTSLGYTDFDAPLTGSTHTYAELNGNTTMAAIAADFAAKKGLMVFASVGNDGNGAWHYLCSPSDGDSVIAVGAVNTSGVVAGFSSYGPSGDGQIKPDMASVGVAAVVQTTSGGLGTNNGTSFACPNMAGLGTCLWQGFPEFNNMRIVRALKEAGSIFSVPNDRIGYGIPDLKAAFTTLLVEYATSTAAINNCTVTLNWNSKDVAAMKYQVERKTPGDVNYTKIADVPAQAGNNLAIHNYQFNNTLTNITAGTISYRIRQIVDTAAATFAAAYIDTANVVLASSCVAPVPVGDLFQVRPTPTTGDATLIVQTNDAISNMPINIYDMKGRLVMRLSKSKGSGQVTIPLPVNVLAAGKYIIKVYNSQKEIGTAEMLKL
jgi:serine protease AprX